jgi:imidazolonepropionase-like amidohydrolase
MVSSSFILAGWLIDGTGGSIRSNILIHIEDGVIASLKKVRSDEPAAIHMQVLDLSHCTILPALVDCHVHLTMSGTVNEEYRKRQLGFTFEQARSAIADHLLEHLAHGVLAVRDGGDSAAYTLRYKKERTLHDKSPVHVKAAGKAWHSRGRYGRLIGVPPSDGCTLAHCIASQKEKPDHIKIINSGLNSLTNFGKETPPQFTQDDLDAAVQTGRRFRLDTMVHANGRVPVRMAVEAGCRSIEHGFFMGRENIERMAELQVFWVPTAFSMKAYSRELAPGSVESEVSVRNLDHQLEQIAYARHLGAPVVIGTDSGGLGIHHGRSFVEELKLLMEAGFSLEDGIRCGSFDGARLLGLDHELGSLKKGMPATFLAARGTPSDLPESLLDPERVYVRGKLISSDAVGSQ